MRKRIKRGVVVTNAGRRINDGKIIVITLAIQNEPEIINARFGNATPRKFAQQNVCNVRNGRSFGVPTRSTFERRKVSGGANIALPMQARRHAVATRRSAERARTTLPAPSRNNRSKRASRTMAIAATCAVARGTRSTITFRSLRAGRTGHRICVPRAARATRSSTLDTRVN